MYEVGWGTLLMVLYGMSPEDKVSHTKELGLFS